MAIEAGQIEISGAYLYHKENTQASAQAKELPKAIESIVTR